jgi:hypothetical protein
MALASCKQVAGSSLNLRYNLSLHKEITYLQLKAKGNKNCKMLQQKVIATTSHTRHLRTLLILLIRMQDTAKFILVYAAPSNPPTKPITTNGNSSRAVYVSSVEFMLKRIKLLNLGTPDCVSLSSSFIITATMHVKNVRHVKRVDQNDPT